MIATEEHKPAAPPPSPPITTHPYIGILGVFFGAATSQLNGKLLTAGLPDLRGALGYSFDGASWIPTALNMGMMFTAVFGAFLGAHYGIRRVLLLGGAVFTAVAIVLPFAPSLGLMLALQAIAGIALGPFYTLTMTFVARNLPTKLLLFGVAAYAMDIVVSSHLGQYVHGWYMDHLSWRWTLWTGAPMMAVTMLCIYFGVLPADQTERPSWRGFLYMSVGLSLIYGGLDQGNRLDWLHSGIFVSMMAGGVFLLLAAIVRHFYRPNPLLNLRFLGARNVIIIGLGIFTIRFSLLGSLVVIPSYLGSIAQYRPLQTGAALAWISAPQFVVVWIAAIACVFIPPRILMAAGLATVAVGCWMGSHLDSSWAGNSFVHSELVIAIGIGVAFVSLVTNIILILVELGGLTSVTSMVTYSAFMHAIRMMGGQIGAVALGRFIAVREQFHSNLLGQYVDPGNWIAVDRLRRMAGALTPPSASADEALARSTSLLSSQVRAQAYTLAFSDAFLLIAWVIAAYLVLVAFLRPSTINLRNQEKSK
jgi:DHA2 family multidrug resistance protein